MNKAAAESRFFITMSRESEEESEERFWSSLSDLFISQSSVVSLVLRMTVMHLSFNLILINFISFMLFNCM